MADILAMIPFPDDRPPGGVLTRLRRNAFIGRTAHRQERKMDDIAISEDKIAYAAKPETIGTDDRRAVPGFHR